MANLKKIMSVAWAIARDGAERFGGSVRLYFRAALKAAWGAEKAPAKVKTLEEIVAELEALPQVWSANIWMDRRIYVNINGRNAKFAGDRNAKVYWDIKSQRWVFDGLKGNMSSDFGRNIKWFSRVYCGQLIWG